MASSVEVEEVDMIMGKLVGAHSDVDCTAMTKLASRRSRRILANGDKDIRARLYFKKIIQDSEFTRQMIFAK